MFCLKDVMKSAVFHKRDLGSFHPFLLRHRSRHYKKFLYSRLELYRSVYSSKRRSFTALLRTDLARLIHKKKNKFSNFFYALDPVKLNNVPRRRFKRFDVKLSLCKDESLKRFYVLDSSLMIPHYNKNLISLNTTGSIQFSNHLLFYLKKVLDRLPLGNHVNKLDGTFNRDVLLDLDKVKLLDTVKLNKKLRFKDLNKISNFKNNVLIEKELEFIIKKGMASYYKWAIKYDNNYKFKPMFNKALSNLLLSLSKNKKHFYFKSNPIKAFKFICLLMNMVGPFKLDIKLLKKQLKLHKKQLKLHKKQLNLHNKLFKLDNNILNKIFKRLNAGRLSEPTLTLNRKQRRAQYMKNKHGSFKSGFKRTRHSSTINIFKRKEWLKLNLLKRASDNEFKIRVSFIKRHKKLITRNILIKGDRLEKTYSSLDVSPKFKYAPINYSNITTIYDRLLNIKKDYINLNMPIESNNKFYRMLIEPSELVYRLEGRPHKINNNIEILANYKHYTEKNRRLRNYITNFIRSNKRRLPRLLNKEYYHKYETYLNHLTRYNTRRLRSFYEALYQLSFRFFRKRKLTPKYRRYIKRKRLNKTKIFYQLPARVANYYGFLEKKYIDKLYKVNISRNSHKIPYLNLFTKHLFLNRLDAVLYNTHLSDTIYQSRKIIEYGLLNVNYRPAYKNEILNKYDILQFNQKWAYSYVRDALYFRLSRNTSLLASISPSPDTSFYNLSILPTKTILNHTVFELGKVLSRRYIRLLNVIPSCKYDGFIRSISYNIKFFYKINLFYLNYNVALSHKLFRLSKVSDYLKENKYLTFYKTMGIMFNEGLDGDSGSFKDKVTLPLLLNFVNAGSKKHISPFEVYSRFKSLYKTDAKPILGRGYNHRRRHNLQKAAINAAETIYIKNFLININNRSRDINEYYPSVRAAGLYNKLLTKRDKGELYNFSNLSKFLKIYNKVSKFKTIYIKKSSKRKTFNNNKFNKYTPNKSRGLSTLSEIVNLKNKSNKQLNKAKMSLLKKSIINLNKHKRWKIRLMRRRPLATRFIKSFLLRPFIKCKRLMRLKANKLKLNVNNVSIVNPKSYYPTSYINIVKRTTYDIRFTTIFALLDMAKATHWKIKRFEELYSLIVRSLLNPFALAAAINNVVFRGPRDVSYFEDQHPTDITKSIVTGRVAQLLFINRIRGIMLLPIRRLRVYKHTKIRPKKRFNSTYLAIYKNIFTSKTRRLSYDEDLLDGMYRLIGKNEKQFSYNNNNFIRAKFIKNKDRLTQIASTASLTGTPRGYTQYNDYKIFNKTKMLIRNKHNKIINKFNPINKLTNTIIKGEIPHNIKTITYQQEEKNKKGITSKMNTEYEYYNKQHSDTINTIFKLKPSKRIIKQKQKQKGIIKNQKQNKRTSRQANIYTKYKKLQLKHNKRQNRP